MTSAPANAFDLDTPPDNDFERNGRGEPKIVMPDGSIQTYSRASTFSNYLTDKSGIHRWEGHHAMLGVAKSDQLIDRLRPLEYDGNYKLLCEAEEEAHILARLHAKADYGTAVHAYLDPKTDPHLIPRNPDIREDVKNAREYRDAIGATVHGTEIRCVNDRIGAAGTYDGLWEIPGIGVTMIDWKTGKFDLLSWTVQQAIYAESQHYDIRPGIAPERRRSPMNPLPRRDVAVIMWAPRGERRVKVVPVNLALGRELITEALHIRRVRSQEFQKRLQIPWTPGEVLDEQFEQQDDLAQFTSRAQIEEYVELLRAKWATL